MKVTVLFNWGALSDERSGLSFVLVSPLSVFTYIYKFNLDSYFYVMSFYDPTARTTQKTAAVIKEACLLVRCQVIDVLLLHAYASRNVFTELLPSNKYTRNK
jgi:hypothetical protein